MLAQEPAYPVGNWQSATSETYSCPLHPALTGAELYLKIDVSNDGSFRGEWGEYFARASPSVPRNHQFLVSLLREKRARVRQIRCGRQGVIDLGRLGRSAFSWSAPAVDELAIDLPKDWRGAKDAILYRARMTRDGKGKPATTTPPAGDAGPLLSANALYREFNKDDKAALGTYAGKTLVLEGRRGTLIELSDGGAAIHIADGFTSRALVLVFQESEGGQRHQRRRAVSLHVHRGEFRLSVRPPGRLLDRALIVQATPLRHNHEGSGLEDHEHRQGILSLTF